MIHILIADDHQLVREAWIQILSRDRRFKIIGHCADSAEAVRMSRKLKPHILLLDISMPPFNGLEATEKIRKASPLTGIIAVTMHNQPAYAKKMFQLGALGYVTKNASVQEMTDAILTVHRGRKYLCQEMKALLYESYEEPGITSGVHLLTAREIEVARLIRAGLSTRAISGKLDISVKTVEVHRHHILKKLNVKNSISLVHFMAEHAIHI